MAGAYWGKFFRGGKVIFPEFFPCVKCFFPIENSQVPKNKNKTKQNKTKTRSSPHFATFPPIFNFPPSLFRFSFSIFPFFFFFSFPLFSPIGQQKFPGEKSLAMALGDFPWLSQVLIRSSDVTSSNYHSHLSLVCGILLYQHWFTNVCGLTSFSLLFGGTLFSKFVRFSIICLLYWYSNM